MRHRRLTAALVLAAPLAFAPPLRRPAREKAMRALEAEKALEEPNGGETVVAWRAERTWVTRRSLLLSGFAVTRRNLGKVSRLYLFGLSLATEHRIGLVALCGVEMT